MLSKLALLAGALSLLSGAAVEAKATKHASQTGSLCNGTTLGAGTSTASDPFWYQDITHQGTAAFNTNSSYVVYRDVTSYGAVGDGSTDDTAAIQAAIDDGNRCGLGCNSSTTSPAVVYFPSGTYLVSTNLVMDYYTTMLGDAKTPPTLKASSTFSNTAGNGLTAVLDADPYIPGGYGANYWTNQNNFFRSVRNFVIDTTAAPATTQVIGIHWQVAQATSLQEITINMNSASGTQHVGVYMENGSGGFLSDVTTNGGLMGFYLGNQQFTIRNINVNGAVSGVYGLWNWGFTFMNSTISDCTNAFNLTTGGNNASVTDGANYILDSSISNCENFVLTSTDQTSAFAGSIVIDNAALSNVTNAVNNDGNITVAGDVGTVDLWAQGNVYSTDGTLTYTVGNLPNYTKPSGLVEENGMVFGKSRPQYEAYASSQFASVKDAGAKGDGVTDDTKAIQGLIDDYAGCKILFFDAGTYLYTSTLTIPEGTTIVGEFFPVLLASGSAFSDPSNPTVAIQVGSSGDTGTVEISSMMFSTQGGSSGAIVVEWNVAADSPGDAGMWDSHFRLGGADGTNLQVAQCANTTGTTNSSCDAAYLALHVTSGASAYFENMWSWTSDHDIDDPAQAQVDVYTARGILHEGTSPSWYIGTASEHATLYQYNFNGAKNVFIGLAQTETPYYQPSPGAPNPWTLNTTLGDPTFPSNQTSAWAFYVQDSQDILVGGTGFYSFFQAYDEACLDTYNCQGQIVNVDSKSTGIRFYNLNTVAATFQLSVGGTGLINQAANQDGFQETVTFWSTDSDSSAALASAARTGLGSGSKSNSTLSASHSATASVRPSASSTVVRSSSASSSVVRSSSALSSAAPSSTAKSSHKAGKGTKSTHEGNSRRTWASRRALRDRR